MLAEFKKDIDRYIEKFPQHKEEILEYYQLALDEIEQGGSVENEISLCISDIDQLIDDEN